MALAVLTCALMWKRRGAPISATTPATTTASGKIESLSDDALARLYINPGTYAAAGIVAADEDTSPVQNDMPGIHGPSSFFEKRCPMDPPRKEATIGGRWRSSPGLSQGHAPQCERNGLRNIA